jgi:hypothetical protein
MSAVPCERGGRGTGRRRLTLLIVFPVEEQGEPMELVVADSVTLLP